MMSAPGCLELAASGECSGDNGAEWLEEAVDGKVSDEFRDEHGDIPVLFAAMNEVKLIGGAGVPRGTSRFRFEKRNFGRFTPNNPSSCIQSLLLGTDGVERNVPMKVVECMGLWCMLGIAGAGEDVWLPSSMLLLSRSEGPCKDAIWNSLSESLRISSARLTLAAMSPFFLKMHELSDARRSNDWSLSR